MEFTPSFWLILGLTLVLGWLLGLMSRSGGKRWKQDLERERTEHQAAIRNRDAELNAARTRIAELERGRPVDAHPDDRPHRDSAIDNLDLTRRGGDPYPQRDQVRP